MICNGCYLVFYLPLHIDMDHKSLWWLFREKKSKRSGPEEKLLSTFPIFFIEYLIVMDLSRAKKYQPIWCWCLCIILPQLGFSLFHFGKLLFHQKFWKSFLLLFVACDAIKERFLFKRQHVSNLNLCPSMGEKNIKFDSISFLFRNRNEDWNLNSETNKNSDISCNWKVEKKFYAKTWRVEGRNWFFPLFLLTFHSCRNVAKSSNDEA